MPLTPQGYTPTTVDDEVSDLNGKFLAKVDGALDLAPDQPFGQVIGVFAEKFTELTEAIATLYSAINPANAEAALLVNVCAISGTQPQVATYSYVNATVNLNASTTLHAGATAQVAGQPGNVWVLNADVTNSGGSPANVAAVFRSQNPGPFVANAGTLTVIGTPTIGWNSVTNAADAVPGLAADTNTTLRQKREAELTGQGSGDVDAIRAAVLKVEGVIQAFCFENTTFTPDSNGLPGKSFRVVVWDGASPLASDTDIANAIWSRKPSGMQSYGATSVTITDSAGNPQVVSFDRAAQLRTWVSCTTTPGTLTTDQTNAVKAAIAAYAKATFNLGVSIIALPFRASALLPGVDIDVPTFAFDFHSTPVNTNNLAVTGLQIATVSTTDILVNGV